MQAKEPGYPLTCWVGYTRKLREELGELTEIQIKKAMQAYIHSIGVEDFIKEEKK